MKKFRFSMESVLSYRQQVLDALKAEHGAILAKVRAQEQLLEQLHQHYAAVNEEFRGKKMAGMSVVEARGYEINLRVQEMEMEQAAIRLEELRREEELKRAEVVQAKQDGAAIEKLKEKKLDSYNKEVAKSEERLIDEFVSTTRVMASL